MASFNRQLSLLIITTRLMQHLSAVSPLRSCAEWGDSPGPCCKNMRGDWAYVGRHAVGPGHVSLDVRGIISVVT